MTALVLRMAWLCAGKKPLSGPMNNALLYWCIYQPSWAKMWRSEQTRLTVADDIFEMHSFEIEFRFKFHSLGPVDNKLLLV